MPLFPRSQPSGHLPPIPSRDMPEHSFKLSPLPYPPSCIHFQATSSCRNGDSCVYPHVKVSDSSPICELFARGGWCDREAGTCPESHVWECAEWRSKGVCSKGVKCGLQHVLRAENGRGSEKEAKKDGLEADQELITDTVGVPVEGGFEEQSAFIEFDHGTPADPESDSEAGHEENGGIEVDDEEVSDEEDEDEGEMSDGTATGKLSRQSSPIAVEEEEEGDADDEDEVLGIVM
jgi:hypothetical protein